MAVYMDRAFSFNQFEMEFREPDSCFLIAEKDSKIIAYARIRKNTESDHLMTGSNLELQRFYLAKHVQGTGLADDLMNACLELVKDVDWLWLGVWENNPRAIRFYEKYGFEKFGTHTFRMGEDDQIDFLMRKRIIHG